MSKIVFSSFAYEDPPQAQVPMQDVFLVALED